MNLLNRLTLKNLKLNKKRTIVTIIGIILSVALIQAVSSMYFSLISSLETFEINEKGNYHVAYLNVPKEDLYIFENNRDIEKYYLTKDIGYALINSKNEYKPYAFVKGFTKEALDNLAIQLVSGRYPKNSNEILIPTHLKTNGEVDINIGDTITLDVGTRVINGNPININDPYILEYDDLGNVINEELLEDTKIMTYKVVGIIERPTSGVEKYDSPGYSFITLMDNIDDIDDTVNIYTKYTKKGVKNNLSLTAGILGVDKESFIKYNKGDYLSGDELNSLLKKMGNFKYEYNENSYLIMLQKNPLNNSPVGSLMPVVIIVLIIIVFTSVFCIKNSFDISITEKIKQYGMLRSIGATKKQIRKNVLYEALILGAIGIPLGIICGLFASYILIFISNYLLNESLVEELKLVFSFSYITIILSFILGFITIYLSAIKSAFKAARVSPIESIRNSANIKINKKKIKCPKIISKIFKVGGEISYKNLKRNKRKYRTTVISIIVSTATFIALSSFMGMAFQTVRDELDLTDYNISLSVNDKDTFSFVNTKLNYNNINDYTNMRNVYVSIDSAKYNSKYKEALNIKDNESSAGINLIAIGDYQYKKYIKSLGLKFDDVKDKGILFDKVKVSVYDEKNEKTISYNIRKLDYERGDSVSLLYDDSTINLSLEYITDTLPFGLKNSSYNSIFIIVSDSYFDKYIKDVDDFMIYFDAKEPDKLQDEIKIILKDKKYNINNIYENVKMMNNLFTLIGIFLYGFIIVISLIGITNIFNTITTNMNLRKQEFAMLKSVGMTKLEFNRMIRLESVFMGLKSLLFGVPIGIVLSILIFIAFKSNGAIYTLPIKAILISIIVVFLLITVIMKYSINKISKQNIVETIRRENI